MSSDLDRAEQMLEQYYDKIQEQEDLITNLGDQLSKEVRAREVRQMGASE